MAKVKRLVYLVHWKSEEAVELAAKLAKDANRVGKKAGDSFTVTPLGQRGAEIFPVVRKHPPSAIVIGLDRLPSHGKEVARMLQLGKQTRMVPLLFLGGQPEKVQPLRQLHPAAGFVDWEAAGEELVRICRLGPASPTTPALPSAQKLHFGGGTPLAQKLGIKAGLRVGLWREPDEFQDLLGDLPPDVLLQAQPRAPMDLHLWFVRSRAEFEREFDFFYALSLPKRPLWVIYPKQAAAVRSDLTQPFVRKFSLENGLVDNKICSVSDTWTAMRFVPKQEGKLYKE